MGGQLDYVPVLAMMSFIIVFTICCEQCVRLTRLWIDHFNPLLQPFIDKVISELMILGATAFGIMLVNDFTSNALSDGGLMPTSYYYTLHWIDTVIFVFAIIYVGAACFMLSFCQMFTHWLARVDSQFTIDEFLAVDPNDYRKLPMWERLLFRKKVGMRYFFCCSLISEPRTARVLIDQEALPSFLLW